MVGNIKLTKLELIICQTVANQITMQKTEEYNNRDNGKSIILMVDDEKRNMQKGIHDPN